MCLFRTLVGLLSERAELAALQFLIRLRVDREGLARALAGLVGRGE